MGKRIVAELVHHVPFTAAGAVSGIIIMVIIVFGNVPSHISHTAFYTLHPLHIVVSALATSAMVTVSSGKGYCPSGYISQLPRTGA